MGWGLGSLLRASLRAGWRPLVGLALLIAVAGGALLTGVEASRRTETAFDRMLIATNAWDVLVNPDDGTNSPLTFQTVADLPMVERAGRVDGVFLAPGHVDSFDELEEGFIVFATDGVAAYDLGRPARIEGRLPDPDSVDEVFLSTRAAEMEGLGVGDVYPARILNEVLIGQVEQAGSEEEALALLNSDGFGEQIEFEIVGTGTMFDEVVVDSGFSTGSMLVTPAFWEAYDQPSAGFYGAFVDLKPGVAVDDFRAAVEATVPGETIAFQTLPSIEAQAERAIRPQVAALRVFTLVAGLIGLVIVGQAVSRRLQLDAITYAPLRALGLTERQRASLALARTAVAATAGGLLAVATAVVASPVAPVGLARDAEPAPGLRVEWVVVIGGAVLVVATVLAIAVWPAIASTRAREPRRQRASASSWVAAAGFAPPVVAGTRFALDPGPSNVPTRSTLVGAVTAVVLVVATLTFAASLDNFIDSPRLYGTPWDTIVSVEGDGEVAPPDVRRLLADVGAPDEVEAYGLLKPGQVLLDDISLPAMAIRRSAKPIQPTLTTGRLPASNDEVALGAVTLDRLGVDVGDTVRVTRGEDSTDLAVVGRVVLPAVSAYPGADKTSLGEGALLTERGLRRWSPEFSPVGALVDLADGTDVDAYVDAVDDPEDDIVMSSTVPNLPSDVQSLERVRSTPLVLAGLLTVLIALTVVHALGAAVRSRRRDLAVLRTFGFTRRQVLAAVAVQATLIALVGLVIGIPVGIVVGRLAWSEVIDRFGGLVDLVTPAGALALVSLAVVVTANLVGVVPGLRAARAHTASILRAE
ncbi:MAG TPA: FtsX-like permease family protein [Acidimicrobiales bacterium]